MKTKSIYDFTVSYNPASNPDIFSNNRSNVVYRLTFPDNTFYIGSCTNMWRRLLEHCKNSTEEKYCNQCLYAKKQEYKRFVVDILHKDIKNTSTMFSLEKEEIAKAADYISKQYNLRSYDLNVINKYLLNRKLYYTYSQLNNY